MCTIDSTATAKNMEQRVIINKPMVGKMQPYKIVHSSKRRQEKRGKGTKEIQDKQKKSNNKVINVNRTTRTRLNVNGLNMPIKKHRPSD